MYCCKLYSLLMTNRRGDLNSMYYISHNNTLLGSVGNIIRAFIRISTKYIQVSQNVFKIL